MREGQGCDSGKDERLRFGVAGDFAGVARAEHVAVFGKGFIAGLPGVQGQVFRARCSRPGVQGRWNGVFDTRFNGVFNGL